MWMAYGGSKRNPQTWLFSDLTDSRLIFPKKLVSATDDGFKVTGDNTRVAVTTSTRYSQTQIELNHDRCKAQGFMASQTDFRDVEITAQLKMVNSGPDGKCSFRARTGEQGRSCEGTYYLAELSASGQIRCEVSQWYPGGTTTLDSNQGTEGDIEDKWIGIKVLIYNDQTDQHVNMEVWIDENLNNHFQRKCMLTDTGIGDKGSRCSTDQNEVITWGGPLVVFQTFDNEEVQLRNFSVREIDPFNRYGTGGGIGNSVSFEINGDDNEIRVPRTGENNYGGESPDIAGESTSPDDPEPPGTIGGSTGGSGDVMSVGSTAAALDTNAYTAGDCTKNLYELTGKSEKFNEGPFKIRHYASGKPDDITKEWNTRNGVPFANMEVTLYITITDPDHDDTISCKFYGPNHDDGIGAWFIVDLTFMNGTFTIGYEEPHPNTPKPTIIGDSMGSILDKRIGFKAVIWKLGNSAHVEGWGDNGDGMWKKHVEADRPYDKDFSPDEDQKVQLRIDASPHMNMECITCRENTPDGVFVGGGVVTPPTGVDLTPIVAAPITHNLRDYGGPKWSGCTFHFIFWTSAWNTLTTPYTKAMLTQAATTIINDTKYFEPLLAWGIKRPKLGTFAVNTSMAIPTTPTSNNILAFVRDSISRGLVPDNAVDEKNAYMVFLPPGHESGVVNTTAFHSYGPFPYKTSNKTIVFGAVEYLPTFNGNVESLTHELIEAMTDPICDPPFYGILKDRGPDQEDALITEEIVDLCNHATTTVGGLSLANYWDDQFGGCHTQTENITFISCHIGATWNPATQTCVATPDDTNEGDVDLTTILANPKSHDFIYNGGKILDSAKVYFIFWGSDWNTRSTPYGKSQIQASMEFLFNFTRFFDGLIQYNIKRPTIGAFVVNTTYAITNDNYDSIPLCVLDTIAKGLVPDNTVGGNNVYYVISPFGWTPSPPLVPGAAGWHDVYPLTFTSNQKRIYYCFSYHMNNFDAQTQIMSHELIEVLTDPEPLKGMYADPLGKFKDVTTGKELADVCETQFSTLTTSPLVDDDDNTTIPPDDTTEPPDDTTEPPTGTGSGAIDKFGVKATYATGNIKYDWVENFRSDGKRFDFEGLGSTYPSAELIGYFACDDPPDDEVSGKMGGGHHDDGTEPKVYDMGVGINDGATRYRLEQFHPTYIDGESGGRGKPLANKYVGYKFIKWNKSNGVLLEIWQDAGNNEGSAPANQWVKLASWLVTKYKWFIPPDDHQETIRIDGD